jgi:MFS family permease
LNIREILDHGPMTGLQIRTIAICFVLNMLDGLDIASISYAAPALSEAWQIPPVTLGIVFSAALGGMMAGSLLLAPLGDAIGRRNTLLLSLALIAVGMVGTVFTTTVSELLAARFVTGFGLGGVVPTMATLAAEFSALKRRNFAVTLVSAGYTLGSALTGLAALWLISSLGWVSLFALGAVLTIAMLPVVYFRIAGLPPDQAAARCARRAERDLARDARTRVREPAAGAGCRARVRDRPIAARGRHAVFGTAPARDAAPVDRVLHVDRVALLPTELGAAACRERRVGRAAGVLGGHGPQLRRVRRLRVGRILR